MIFDEDTGEIINDKFAQLYFKDIEKLFCLTTTAKNVLFLMVKAVGLGNTNSVSMTPKRKKEFAKILELKTYRTIDKVLKELSMADIAKKLNPEDEPYRYTINPDILFSGNEYQRVEILIDYSSGSRRIKAFADDKQLEKYLLSEKED